MARNRPSSRPAKPLKILVVAGHCASDHSVAVQLKGFVGGYRGLGHEAVVLKRDKDRGRLVAEADFVHFLYHGGLSPRLLSAWKEALRRCKPYGVTFEGHPKNEFEAGEAKKLRRFLLSAAWTAALSPYSARKISKRLPYLKQLPIIPNGLDQRVIDLARRPEPKRRPAARPFVLCVARQQPYKGVDLLLWAWKDVQRKYPGIRLLIAGRNDHGRHYQRLARILKLGPDVRFLGKLGFSRVCALMRSCLFFALPSRDETFGLAALEAMSFGKAVLATAAGPSAFIRAGRSGLLVEPGSLPALKRGLLRLLSDGELRRRLGLQARKAALNYRWDASALRFTRLIERSAPSARPAQGTPR